MMQTIEVKKGLKIGISIQKILFLYLKSLISMPRKDSVQDAFVNALQLDGWVITHDPLTLKLRSRSVFVDLGAEKLLEAEKDGQKIAIEVKSFTGHSVLTEFYRAIGQYRIYTVALKKQYPDYQLFLAMPISAYELLEKELLGDSDYESAIQIKIIIFDTKKPYFIKWIV
ncbi:MAG: hypothetical protein RL329_881 [Bacteroidota bacterium]